MDSLQKETFHGSLPDVSYLRRLSMAVKRLERSKRGATPPIASPKS